MAKAIKFTMKLKGGKSYTVSEATANSFEEIIEEGSAERVVFWDKTNGSVNVVVDQIESINKI